MVDFASVYNLANKPTTELQNPMDIAIKGQHLQQMSLANAMAQQQQNDDQTARGLAASGQYQSPEDLAKAMEGQGLIKQSQAIRQQQIDQQKKIADIRETLSKADEHTRKLIDWGSGKMYAFASDETIKPDTWNKGLDILQGQMSQINPRFAGQFEKYKVSGSDPTELTAKRQLAISNALPVQEAIKSLGTNVMQVNGNLVPVRKDALGNAKAGEPIYESPQGQTGALYNFAASVPGGLNEDQTVNLQNPHVAAHLRKMNYIAPQIGGNLQGLGSVAGIAQTGDSKAALEGVPENIRPLVQAIGTYRMKSTQLSPRQKNEVMGYVAAVFPNYSHDDAESNTKFIKDLASTSASSAGGTVAASERLLGHVGELADLTDKLPNSSLGKLGNIAAGTAATTFGTESSGTIKAFELTKGKVIAELNKLANGGVPHAEEMVRDVKQLEYSDPPATKYEVMKAAVNLGLEQTHAVEARRNNILGQYAPKTSLLSTRAQNTVNRIYDKLGEKANLEPATTGGYTTTAITNQNKATLDAATAAKVQALRSKGVSEADIQAALQARGQ